MYLWTRLSPCSLRSTPPHTLTHAACSWNGVPCSQARTGSTPLLKDLGPLWYRRVWNLLRNSFKKPLLLLFSCLPSWVALLALHSDQQQPFQKQILGGDTWDTFLPRACLRPQDHHSHWPSPHPENETQIHPQHARISQDPFPQTSSNDQDLTRSPSSPQV